MPADSENTCQRLRQNFYSRSADQHENTGIHQTAAHALADAFRVLHAVAERHNRRNRVTQTKCREQNKLLNFVHNAISGDIRTVQTAENQINTIIHHAHRTLCYDGRYADGVNLADDTAAQAQSLASERQFPVQTEMEHGCQSQRRNLTEHGCPCRTCYAQFRTAEQTVDHNRVKHDVRQCACHLCNRGIE